MKNPGEFVLTMMNARTAAHIAHLQTTSYAAHVALNEFYDGIIPLVDSFAKAYQGCYGLIKFTGSNFKLEKDPVVMLSGLKDFIKQARKECDETALQNILDEMTALVASTIYKLKFLK